MKVLPVVISILLSSISFGQAHLNSAYTDIVFVDSTNIRSTPSTSGKIIGKINHYSEIKQCYSMETVEGKVGTIEDRWIPIKFQEQIGYIWRPNLADGSFKSELDLDNQFLINFVPNKGLEFKIFRNNNFVASHFFEDKVHKDLLGSASFGTTFNSNGKEIIAIVYETNYELFEWDGISVTKSTILLEDDSFITGKYHSYSKGIINKKQANLRVAPSQKASISEKLDVYTLVELVDKKPIEDRLDGVDGYWYTVKRNNKTLYVWSQLIDVPRRYVKSNKVKNESFLYTTNAIYVLKNSKFIHRTPIDNTIYYYDDDYNEQNDFVQFGNRGLNMEYQFLGICYSAESCGEAGGDDLYIWDGKKLTHFGNDFSVGDGGYSSGHSYVFPNQPNGIKDKILFYEEESEYAGYEIESEESNTYIFSSSRYEMQFNGDSLVEITSKDSRAREFIKDTLPLFNILHATFSDLNRDGIDDLTCLLSKDIEEKGEPKSLTYIGIAFGNQTGSFQKININRSLVKSNYHSVLFKPNSDTLEILVNYNIGYDSDETHIPSCSKFKFVFDQAYQKLIWDSKTECQLFTIENQRARWNTLNFERFKKNKVSFENAWESKKY